MSSNTLLVNRSSMDAHPGRTGARSPGFVSLALGLVCVLCVGLARADVEHDDDDDDGPANAPQSNWPPSGGIWNVPDADGDGIPAGLEFLLGTSPACTDTDYDGFSDLEEIARHSSPLSAASKPDLTKRLGVGVMVQSRTDGLHGLISVFMADTELRTKRLTIGFVNQERFTEFSHTFVAQNSTIQYFPSATTTGCVALIDLRFPASLVHGAGDIALFARAALPGASHGIADGAHLLSMAGLVVWAMPAPAPILQHAGCSPSSGGTPSGGSIYVPLLPGPSTGGGTGGGAGGGGGSGGGSGGATIPLTWDAGEVCFQRATPIGAQGATITNEIISAECVEDWEGFCPPSCSQSVGTTYRTVDPLVLIGG